MDKEFSLSVGEREEEIVKGSILLYGIGASKVELLFVDTHNGNVCMSGAILVLHGYGVNINALVRIAIFYESGITACVKETIVIGVTKCDPNPIDIYLGSPNFEYFSVKVFAW